MNFSQQKAQIHRVGLLGKQRLGLGTRGIQTAGAQMRVTGRISGRRAARVVAAERLGDTIRTLGPVNAQAQIHRQPRRVDRVGVLAGQSAGRDKRLRHLARPGELVNPADFLSWRHALSPPTPDVRLVYRRDDRLATHLARL